jgi:hypothetical protein
MEAVVALRFRGAVSIHMKSHIFVLLYLGNWGTVLV